MCEILTGQSEMLSQKPDFGSEKQARLPNEEIGNYSMELPDARDLDRDIAARLTVPSLDPLERDVMQFPHVIPNCHSALDCHTLTSALSASHL
jgi:hypothetical protein